MDPLTGAMIMGGIQSVGQIGATYLGAKMSAKAQKEQNLWHAEQAGIQRDWTKMMSDTSHQREVKDLKSAGLNPILSVGGGSGATNTAGSMAHAGEPPGKEGIKMGVAIASALQGLRYQKALTRTEKIRQEVEKAELPEREARAKFYKTKFGRSMVYTGETLKNIAQLLGIGRTVATAKIAGQTYERVHGKRYVDYPRR